MHSRPFNCLIVLGPTASGKTKLAVRLAWKLGAEIISLDSRQVYREMNIGTGKDYEDYRINGQSIPVHLIDVAEPGSTFHLHHFLQHFSEVFKRLTDKNSLPILCGGTALYLQALLHGFEYTSVPVNEKLREELKSFSKAELTEHFLQLPQTAYTGKADLSTSKRIIRAIEISEFLSSNPLDKLKLPVLQPLVFGIDLSRELRRQRIEERLTQRLQNGLIDEVQHLLQNGVSADQLIRYGLEYKFVVEYLQGKLNQEEMQIHLTIAIQQFAKRQMTWFRKLEREGLSIHWIDGTLSPDEQAEIALNIVSSQARIIRTS